MQTRAQSLAEVICSTVFAMALSVALGMIVYPLFGHRFSAADNVWITAIFTVVSIIRSYWTRRLFNYLHGKQP